MRGPFLTDIQMTWVWAILESLNQTYISTLLQLSDLYMLNKAPEKAQAIWLRALGFDACLEEVHCLLMKNYAAQGDRLAVARQYQSCKEALRNELDISPSDETNELYHQLMD